MATSLDDEIASTLIARCPEPGSLPGNPPGGRTATYSGASDVPAIHITEASPVCYFKEAGRPCAGQVGSPVRRWHVGAIKHLAELPKVEAFHG